jgi:hypothetical protein
MASSQSACVVAKEGIAGTADSFVGEKSPYRSLIDGRLVFWKNGSNGMDFKSRR